MALTQVQGGMILASGQSIPKAALPTGSVLQVVQATTATPVITASTTYVTTNLAVSITPTSVSSKILVISTALLRKTNTNPLGISAAIFRNSTNVYTGASNQFYITATSGEPSGVVTLNYLDSPATTSSISYSLQIKSLTASTTAVFLPDSETGSIIAMEIAA
jgi:hypothetical protein